MYNKLKVPSKLNWFSQLRQMLIKADHEYLMDCNTDVETIKLALFTIDGALKNKSFIEDRQRAIVSTFSPLYREIKCLDVPSRETYLTLVLRLPFIRRLATCRLADKLELSFYCNKELYKINGLDTCSLCNLKSNETLFHIACYCPLYKNLRDKFTRDSSLLEI